MYMNFSKIPVFNRPFDIFAFYCYSHSTLETKILFSIIVCCLLGELFYYSETLNNEYIERILQMSYSSLSDNVMLLIFSFLIK